MSSGGRGTRPLVKDSEELSAIKKICEKSDWCLSVCTGSAVSKSISNGFYSLALYFLILHTS